MVESETVWLAVPVRVKTAYGEASLTVGFETLTAAIVLTVIVTVLLIAFVLLEASVNVPRYRNGPVRCAVRCQRECCSVNQWVIWILAMVVSVPPLTVMSVLSKLLEASEGVNVIIAVSPVVKVLSLVVIEIDGGVVSATAVLTVIVTVLSASAPSVFGLLLASVNDPLATEMTPLAVLLAVGVNIAVKTNGLLVL